MRTHPRQRRKSFLQTILAPALGLLCMAGIGVTSTGCKRTPVTDRVQYNVIPDDVLIPLGVDSYKQMLQGERIVRETEAAESLQRVGRRISKVAREPDYRWEYRLVKDDKMVNAWCLPGGKIAFYTGILPALENEAGMAFVMGHEVAHATARHAGERLTQQLTIVGGLTALQMYLTNKSQLSQQSQQLILAALGLGAQVGIQLPFSRKQEKEADVIGMMYMAGAGYPPTESIAVWDRMSRMSGGQKTPAFLATHPPHAKRQENLRDWMPRAKKRYRRNALDRDTQVATWDDGDY